MSLLDKKLSVLLPGSHVRFTNLSGQVIEGIVAENDGKESLSIQITSLATIRYDQIGMVDEYGQRTIVTQEVPFTNKETLPIAESKPLTVEMKPSIVEIEQLIINKESISRAYKAMESNEKKAFEQPYNKFQSYLKSHEESKYDEALDLIWDIIHKNEWGYNPRVNLMLAYIQLSHNEYAAASESFFYADNYRYAYCAAYQGCDEDNSLYQQAAAFSAIYLSSGSPDEIAEASEVLRKTSVISEDISGIEYVLKHTSSEKIKENLLQILKELGKNCVKYNTELSDAKKLSECLKQYYPADEIEKKIEDFLSQVPAKETNDVSDEIESTVSNSEPDITQEHKGKIVTYNYFEEKGTVKDDEDREYSFEVKDIKDISLKNQVKKITSKQFKPISVKFTLSKLANQYVVSVMKRGIEPPTPESINFRNTIAFANSLFTNKDYTGAIEIYKQHMDDEDWEVAFSQVIMCYLALSNEDDEFGYLEEIRAFVEKYVGQTTKNTKTLEALQQFYMKIHNYEGTLNALNDLMDLCDSNEYGRILHYIVGKERCYRFMKNYPSAISELTDWLEIVKRYKIKDYYQRRDTLIYPELAELYFESEDYENAEKYANLSSKSERIQALKEKLEAKRAELDPEDAVETDESNFDDEDDMIDESVSEPEESLQTAYEEYTDADGFDALNMDDTSVISTALSFDANHLYCLLTYLNSASAISMLSKKTRTDENRETVYVGQAIKAVDTAVAYAFNSPLMDSEYLSTEIMVVYEEAQKYLPDILPSMFAASALYALFNTPSIPDYGISDFSVVVENYGLEQHPALIPLINDLVSFRESTGYGMDSFASYKTSTLVLESIIEESKSYCESIDMRNDIFENQGQVRKLREIMFSNEDSELRTCLNIVAANDINKYQYVKNMITELLIRSGKVVAIDNLDTKKVDKFIDSYWERARDLILDEGRHISRPHDKIKGNKRNNIVIKIRHILSCICDWLSVAEHSSGNDNNYASSQYDKLMPKVISELNDIITSCTSVLNKRFDWGTESIRRAAEQILSKMNGTYSNKSRRYFFIDFLKGEDVLLNDSYLPEIQSTFCGVPRFNILSRIERHASKEHLELHERFTEILSNVESKHNFRTARLIKAYGEDMDIKEIIDHKNLAQYNDCLKQARQRFETKSQDFYAELELCESYGTISNINGEKDKIWAIADNWYRISKITGDYGFYVRLLEVLRNDISVKAEKKGEQLMRQLEDIASKPNYNFGVFSKEMIEAKINDQNFSSAEFIMGCILRGDVNAISDYSDEPFGYFKEFISEHATNSRAVRGAGRDIADIIFEYSGKKDLEKALVILTNNAHKETKGGANLLKSWIPRGGPTNTESLTVLLTRLGFKPVSVALDESIDFEAYHVFCRKQIGKVNYVHHIPAFGSKSETEGFRVLCLYGNYNCDALMDKFRSANATAKHTLVLLDFALNIEERRRLAKKIKEEKSFSKTFIVLDRVVLFYLAKHYAENTVLKRLLAVTLPFAYYQPFVEASRQDMPPELFTGRETELTSIESPEGANLVYGGRQLGKSALLKMARRNIDRNANGDRAVLIEIKDMSAADALKVVCDKLILENIIDENCKCETWNELAGYIQRRLMSDDPEKRINYFLLMLDEADTFIATSGETEDQPITALKNLPSDRFKLVMAGLHNLSRYNRQSRHGNSNLIHLTPITVKQFRREEATKLLTSILAYLGFKFNQKIIDSILASTYNYPGLIQFYCQKLLEAMKNDDYAGYNESSTPTYEVTESHYKKVLSDKAFTELVDQKFEATLFAEEEGHSNYHIIALILAYLYYIEPNDKGYTEVDLLKIAEEYHINRVTSLKSEQLSEVLNEMCDLNVITVMEENYRFATDGFRKYLGNQDKIEKSMSEYFEEAVTV